jgi:hypothetical protein
MDHAAYLREIVVAYQAEVRGEATFSTLALEDPEPPRSHDASKDEAPA